MEIIANGKIIKGVGGLYEIRLDDGGAELRKNGIGADDGRIYCKARGAFRHEGLTLLAGDEVSVKIDTALMLAGDNRGEIQHDPKKTDEARAGVMIDKVFPRRSELIRPPMANLDMLFISFAAAKPDPSLSVIDKLTTIADFKKIEPVIVVTKADISPEAAEHYAEIYRACGFTVFIEGVGIDSDEIARFIHENRDKTMAFAGASGVGKSTLMNRLFPSLGLTTGEISQKAEHGRHTTRRIELYPLDGIYRAEGGAENETVAAKGYVADTPGFGMLDFVQFDFYAKEDLPYVFREFEPYLGKCRYTKCSHTKEEGCAILEAVREGKIPPERHKSYLEFFEVLKNKHIYKN